MELKEKAKEQLSKSCEWFMKNVKCCYNCKHWAKDISLMNDYAYNGCLKTKNTMTAWDNYCDEYDGTKQIDNYLVEAKNKGITKEELGLED